VLMPDGASKYISKIFNDDWMRENGFLEEEKSLGTVRELLGGKGNPPVVTASAEEKVREVIDKMKKHGISQLPVVEGGKLRGLVHEVDLLRHLVQGSGTLDSAVSGLVESDYGTVTMATKVELLQGVLSEAALAIVLDNKEMVTGVITKIDLIEFLARHKAPPAA